MRMLSSRFCSYRVMASSSLHERADERADHRVAEGVRLGGHLDEPRGAHGLQALELADRRRPLPRLAVGEEVVLAQQRARRAVHRVDVEALP